MEYSVPPVKFSSALSHHKSSRLALPDRGAATLADQEAEKLLSEPPSEALPLTLTDIAASVEAPLLTVKLSAITRVLPLKLSPALLYIVKFRLLSLSTQLPPRLFL